MSTLVGKLGSGEWKCYQSIYCISMAHVRLASLMCSKFESNMFFENAFTARTFQKGCGVSSRRTDECVINGYITNQLVWVLPYLFN